MPLIIHLSKQNLVYVSTPKVASTTMIDFMYAMAGMAPTYGNPRKAMRKPEIQSRLRELGVRMFVVASEDLVEFQASHADNYYISVTRDPYHRLVSSYHSKLHRYAEKFDRASFWIATFGRLKGGIKAIEDSRFLARHVGLRISFDEMVNGLSVHGISFDDHFDLQVRNLAFGKCSYDKVIEQQDLEIELREVCNSISQPYPFQKGLPNHNSSLGPERIPVNPGRETLEKIRILYSEDFKELGYDPP